MILEEIKEYRTKHAIYRTNYIPDCNSNDEIRKVPCLACNLSLEPNEYPVEDIYDQSSGHRTVTATLSEPTRKDQKPMYKGNNCGYRIKAYNIDNGCEILMVGEAPGFTECVKGIQFIGSSGMVLRKGIDKLTDLSEDIFGWTNTVQCRPPKNSTPKASQIKACLPHLLWDIRKSKPRVIAAVGAVAAKVVVNHLAKRNAFHTMMQEHGRFMVPVFYREARVVVILHPAAVLRAGQTSDTKEKTYRSRMEDDIKFMEECYKVAVEKDKRFKPEKALTW